MGPAIARTWRCSPRAEFKSKVQRLVYSRLYGRGEPSKVESVSSLCKIAGVQLREKLMGKGDRRTRKGKIYRGSYGKTRPGRPKKKAKPAPKR
jgi:30S ribosomal protein S31